MPFRDCSRMSEGNKKAPSLKSVTYILQLWDLVVIPYLKSIQKYINHVIHFLTPANISIFSTEISNFSFIKKYSYRLCFHIYFLILLTLFESLKVALITIVAILMMSTKLAALSTIYMREVIITWILFKFGSSSIIWNWH